MFSNVSLLMLMLFTITVLFILWRPFGIHEVIPTTISASLIIGFGIVSLQELMSIFGIVSGPALTILSTIIMATVLESLGFFRLIANNIISRAKGSGIKLFIYTNLLCFFTTILFNNDGSILITTPIIIYIIKVLRFKPHERVPYLLSGVLIATAASAPIAISNISNLIALEMLGITLTDYIRFMFIPAMLGISVMFGLLFLFFKKDIPKKMPIVLHNLVPQDKEQQIDWAMLKICLAIIVLTRASFFILAPFVDTEWVGLGGATILLAYQWVKTRKGPVEIVRQTPWHVFLFAFNMYVLVYGLRNVGIIDVLVSSISEFAGQDALNATMAFGLLATVLSNLMNNLPAVMIGTFAVLDMSLSPLLMQLAYFANILGSDIGALLTPIGTLATLIWFYLLRKGGIHMTWGKYLRVTVYVIPISLAVSLFSLYIWVLLIGG